MPRSAHGHLAFTLGALTLAGCGDQSAPTAPDSSELSPAALLTVLERNTWTVRASPADDFRGQSAGVVPNSAGQSIVYLITGTTHEGGSGFPVQAYNVTTDVWTTKATSTYLYNMNGVGVVGGKLYFSGGYDYGTGVPGGQPTYTAWQYDPLRDRLIQQHRIPIASGDGITGVIDDKLYVLPGKCAGDYWPQPGWCEHEPTRKLFRFVPATNVWTQMAKCPHFHMDGAGGVIGGKFYVAGGSDGSDLDVYDPATNSWKTLAFLPVPAQSAIGAVLHEEFYVIVGTSTYAYNPMTNRWKSRASTTWPHDALVQVRYNGAGHLLAVGGFHGDTYVANPNELYTP